MRHAGVSGRQSAIRLSVDYAQKGAVGNGADPSPAPPCFKLVLALRATSDDIGMVGDRLESQGVVVVNAPAVSEIDVPGDTAAVSVR